jgi:hypothetical protein
MKAVSFIQSGKFKYFKLAAPSINASPGSSKTTEPSIGVDLIVFWRCR